VWKHRDLQRKNPTLIAAQISDHIAGFFSHCSDINQGIFARRLTALMTRSRAREAHYYPSSLRRMRRDPAGEHRSPHQSPP
jgi:hypothetical protein